MSKTILIGGYGPGISHAVARRFGREGFQVALVARSADKLAKAVEELAKADVKAHAFTADLGDPAAAAAVVGKVHDKVGPIAAILWNAYGGAAGDLMKADAAEINAAVGIATTSLVAVVQAAHADLKAQKGGVLVTNGGFGLLDPKMDAVAVQFQSMGLALANAAKNKLVGMLSARLRDDGIYVGQVMVLGMVKGTAWDNGTATVEPEKVAAQYWDLFTKRDTQTVNAS